MNRRRVTYETILPSTLGSIILVFVSGCLSTTGPVDPLLLQTDTLAYDLVQEESGVRTSISYVFTNRTGAAVYLVNCNGGFGLHLERNESGAWQTAWSPVLPACLSPPIVIQEDELWADTVSVRAGLPDDNLFPRFDVADPSGTYRIVWDAALDSFQDRLPFGTPLPLPERVSNAFELTLR